MVALPGSVPVARRVCFKSCVIFFLPYYVPFGAAASTEMQIRPSLMASFVGWMMIGDTVDLILLAPEMAPDLVHRLASGGFVHRLEEESVITAFTSSLFAYVGASSAPIRLRFTREDICNKKGTVTGVNCKWLAPQPGVDGNGNAN
uniref:Uncharacterized protein n=2 Tax=Oryza rufipogon TaxID=4529 RepID=A0A0E0QQS2_ORYRU